MNSRTVNYRGSLLPELLIALACTVLIACSKPTAPPQQRAPQTAIPKATAQPPTPAKTAREKPFRRSQSAIFKVGKLTSIHLELGHEAIGDLRFHERRYTRATVTIDAVKHELVGVRLKGHRSMRELGKRPSFILHFAKFAPGREHDGLQKLVLNALVEDPTLVRETLGYRLYRKMGVAAPRTGYVRLRVNDGDNRLYLAVEPVDERMLAGHYKDATGSLYEGEYGCDVNSEDIWGFDLDGGTDTSRQDFAEFAKRMPRGVTSVYADEDGAVDKKRLLAFLAMSTVIADFDGYRHHHNYFLYHDPGDKRWSLIPWGIDRIFFSNVGLFDSEGLLSKVCVNDHACRADYIKAVQEAVGIFEAANLPAQVSAIDALIGELVSSDSSWPFTRGKMARKRKQMHEFFAKRSAEMREAAGCIHDGKQVDADGDGFGCMDCDDQNAGIHPGAEELCDGIDNDCTGHIDDGGNCACEKTEIDGSTFEFCDLPMPWRDAAAHCEKKAMFLARIDSRKQSKAVFAFSKTVRKGRWWIGLNDIKEEDEFAWRDGSEVDFVYWKSGEPNNAACGEDCIAIAKRGRGRWYDTHCGLHRPFICRSR